MKRNIMRLKILVHSALDQAHKPVLVADRVLGPRINRHHECQVLDHPVCALKLFIFLVLSLFLSTSVVTLRQHQLVCDCEQSRHSMTAKIVKYRIAVGPPVLQSFFFISQFLRLSIIKIFLQVMI